MRVQFNQLLHSHFFPVLFLFNPFFVLAERGITELETYHADFGVVAEMFINFHFGDILFAIFLVSVQYPV